MTAIRDNIGEIEGRRILSKGDRVKIHYIINNDKKEITGILMSITDSEIEVNGTSPKTKIPIEKIVSIERA